MKEREVFLDKLRVAATCAVVLLHTVTGVMDHTDMEVFPLEKTVFLIILDLVCWSVPVFLLISGYLFLNPNREITLGKMLSRYCRRIVLALLVFGVPYACLEQIATERCFRWGMLGGSLRMVLRGESWSHLWYLYLILFLYLLTPALRKLLKMLPRPVLYVLLAVLCIGSSVQPWLVKLFGLETAPLLPDWGIYLFYYISGSLFRRGRCGIREQESRDEGERPRARQRIKGRETGWKTKNGSVEQAETENTGIKKAGAGTNVCFGLAVVLAAAMACSRLSGNYTVQMAYNYPFTVALSLLLFGWGSNLHETAFRSGKRAADFWKQAAGLSFAVYLVHPVFLNTAYKFFHITPLSFPIGLSVPAFWGLTLLLSAAVARVLYGILPLRKYVL